MPTDPHPSPRVSVALRVGASAGVIGVVDQEPRDTFPFRLADLLRAAADSVENDARFQAIVRFNTDP